MQAAIGRDRLLVALRRPLGGLVLAEVGPVAALSAAVVLLETVLFHMLEYVYDFHAATLAIGCAVLGLGLGCFLASRVHAGAAQLLSLCCGGTALLVLVTAAVLVLWPRLWVAAAVVPLPFVLPGLYVATMFERHPSRAVYVADMAGVGLGVLLTVALYWLLRSEGILLLLSAALSAAALVLSLGGGRRAGWLVVPVLATALVLLGAEIATDSLNLFRIVRWRSGAVDGKKAFRLHAGKPVTSYDNLVGRIDIVRRSSSYHVVAYNGFGNDHFTSARVRDYPTYFAGTGVRFPSLDRRFHYGLVAEPHVFVVGSAAEGIMKSLRRITPPERITAVEVNPALVRVMTRDFRASSGDAFGPVEPVAGNALALLRRSDQRFDLITVMNVHSTRTFCERGAPDPVHTLESYRLFLDRLTDEGEVVFEERPVRRQGTLSLRRQLIAFWRVLEQQGAADPGHHFAVWEWSAGRGGALERWNDQYYVSFLVTKGPLEGERLERARGWFDVVDRSRIRLLYLAGDSFTAEMRDLFGRVGRHDFADWVARDRLDPRPPTLDRPFLSTATADAPELTTLLAVVGCVCLGLWLLFSAGVGGTAAGVALNGFNAAIGLGYLGLEVVLLQACQSVFLSATVAFVVVLSGLLLSSAAGGWLGARLSVALVTGLLAVAAPAACELPNLMLGARVPWPLVQAVAALMVCVVGFLMGTFFPRGLELAKASGFGRRVPYLFGVNTVWGAFAVVLALVLAVKVGYRVSAFGAAVVYGIAGAVLYRAERGVPSPPAEPFDMVGFGGEGLGRNRGGGGRHRRSRRALARPSTRP